MSFISNTFLSSVIAATAGFLGYTLAPTADPVVSTIEQFALPRACPNVGSRSVGPTVVTLNPASERPKLIIRTDTSPGIQEILLRQSASREAHNLD